VNKGKKEGRGCSKPRPLSGCYSVCWLIYEDAGAAGKVVARFAIEGATNLVDVDSVVARSAVEGAVVVADNIDPIGAEEDVSRFEHTYDIITTVTTEHFGLTIVTGEAVAIRGAYDEGVA
jgi:hypothetical protein